MLDHPEFQIDSSCQNFNNASISLDNNSLNILQPNLKEFGSQELLNLAGETLIQAWQNQTNPNQALVYAAGSIFKSNFAANAHTAFGEAFDVNKAQALGTDILGGNYGVLPNVQFLSNAQMNGALGAYAKSNNTIYVNSVFLKENLANPTAVGKVIVEEEGHFLDAYASPIDSPGDEGEMLADLISGDQLSTDQITRIRAEDDTATIVVNGQKLAIEQSSPVPTITISANDANAGETLGGQPTNPGQFNLTRTGSIASALTVNYTVGGTATNGIDYSSLSNSITFAAGSSTALININPIDDFVIENDETVILNLATSTNYNLGTATTATVIIADNDKPTITISANDANAGETLAGQPTNPGQFTLTRTGNNASALAVNYTVAGTATNGIDYSNLSNSITFAAGSSTALINVNPIDDGEFEGNETVILTLATATNYNLGTATTSIVTIADNDKPTITINANDANAGETLAGQTANPGQFTLTRTGNTTSALTVNYTVAGTAINGTDYSTLNNSVTFAAGASTALINITPIDDAEFEGNETAVVNLASSTNYNLGATTTATAIIADNDKPTITISANDANAGETLTGQPTNPGQFTLTRTGNNASALAINYTVAGTATNGIDYSNLSNSITFAAGSSTALINVNPIDDGEFEGNETVILTLATTTNYNLGTATTATVTIADNDKPTITISANDANAGETLAGQPTNPGQFTLTRTGNNASALAVNYTVAGTATNGIDYSNLSNSITFAAGSSTALINVNPIDDFVIENDETVILNLVTSTNYNLGAATTATVIIADNDKPTIDWFSLNLKDEQIRTLARNVASDRDLSRRDMLDIFESAKDWSIIDSNESTDLKVLVNNLSGTPFSIQEPVRWLAAKVAEGAFSNISASQFQSNLVDRWFLGKAAPTARFDRINQDATTTRYDLTYVEVKGNLFDTSGQARIGDIDQGYLGDCAFLAALGATFGRQFGDVGNAVSSVINNMIINNNDNTYTMRFFRNGFAEYVTVDNRLATWNGSLFTSRNNNYLLNPNNPSVPLWMPLVQKAYAQWRESWGNGQTGYTIVGNGADPFDTLSYITGRKVTGGYGSNFTFSTLDNALRNGQAIVTARLSASTDLIVGGHAYSVTNVYIATNGQQRVIVRNPWGVDNYSWKEKSGADDGFIDLSFDDFRKQMDYGVSIA